MQITARSLATAAMAATWAWMAPAQAQVGAEAREPPSSPMPRLIAGLLLVLSAFLHSPAQAQTEVDLALVLAVDISGSMDPEEQALQREGFVEAFRSPL